MSTLSSMVAEDDGERCRGFLIRRTDVGALGSVCGSVEDYLRSCGQEPGAYSIVFRATTPIDALFFRVLRNDTTKHEVSGVESVAVSLSIARSFDLGARIARALSEPIWIRGEVPTNHPWKHPACYKSTAYWIDPADSPESSPGRPGSTRSIEDYASFLGLPDEYAFRHFETKLTPLRVVVGAPLDVQGASSYLAQRPPFGPLAHEPLAGFLVERVDVSALAPVHEVIRHYLLSKGEDVEGRIVSFSTAQGLPLLNVEVPFHSNDLRRAMFSERRRSLLSFVEVHLALGALISAALRCNVWAWEASRFLRSGKRGVTGREVATLDHAATLFTRETESEAAEGLVPVARRLGVDLLALTQLAQTEKVHLRLDAPFRGEPLEAYLLAPPPPYVPPGPNEETVHSFELETWMVREAERIGRRLGCTYNQVFVVAWELGKRAVLRRISRELGPVDFGYRSRLPRDLYVRRAEDTPVAPADGERFSILLAVTWPLIDEALALSEYVCFKSLLADAYRAARPLLFGSFRRDPRERWIQPISNPGMWREYRIPPA